jgi:hypothetical protein
MLPRPPSALTLPKNAVGSPTDGSNDWVDNHLLSAVWSNIVDYLVTEDANIHRKARRLGLTDRVIVLADAISVLKVLFDIVPHPPPLVKLIYIHEIEMAEPILLSIKAEYKDFDPWIDKCRREHRQAYVIKDVNSGAVSAICILKPEDVLPDGRMGKVLKLCTFKVAATESGNRYGELLLKAIFGFADTNGYEYAYFTVFPRHKDLIDFAAEFGFCASDKCTDVGELVMFKELIPPAVAMEGLTALEFHVKYGPRVTLFEGNSSFIVPIQPQYHEILFPECESQLSLLPQTRPCGNSIRKAYLSQSHLMKIRSGDNLFFYRSQDKQSITALGIVENTQRSKLPDTIARHVGKRAVYTYAEIVALCEKPVLAINFRLVKTLGHGIPLKSLIGNRVMIAAPQSIAEVPREGVEWLRQQMSM